MISVTLLHWQRTDNVRKRGSPTDWDHLVEVHDDRDIFQVSPDELPAIDIQSL